MPAAGDHDRRVGQRRDALRTRQRADRLLLRAEVCPRPPAKSALVRRSCALTSAAVTPSAFMRSGLSSTRISRSTPPRRSTPLTPRTPWICRAMTSSTNHRQILGRHRRRRNAVDQDRQACDVDAVDDRLVDRARQVGANPRDRVLDVVQGAVVVGFEPEFDARRRRSFGDRRGDVLDAADARDGVLDALGDLRLQFGRRPRRAPSR